MRGNPARLAQGNAMRITYQSVKAAIEAKGGTLTRAHKGGYYVEMEFDGEWYRTLREVIEDCL